MTPISRAEARQAGSVRYFTGRPCLRGHLSERLVSSCNCIECANEDARAEYKADGGAATHARKSAWRSRKQDEAKATGGVFHEGDRAKSAARKREWGAQNEVRLTARRRELYLKNPEQSLERSRQWAAANPDRRKAIAAKWYAENRERFLRECREKYRHDPEYRAAKLAQGKNRNPDVWKKANRKRRALKAGAEGAFTEADILALFDRQSGLCAICDDRLEGGHHVDHMTPLSRGGSNWPSNLQILCPPCNLRKGALTMEEFRQRQSAQIECRTSRAQNSHSLSRNRPVVVVQQPVLPF